jgi:hypothetical protein
VGNLAHSLKMVVRHNVIEDSCSDFEGGSTRVVFLIFPRKKNMIGHRRGEYWPTARTPRALSEKRSCTIMRCKVAAQTSKVAPKGRVSHDFSNKKHHWTSLESAPSWRFSGRSPRLNGTQIFSFFFKLKDASEGVGRPRGGLAFALVLYSIYLKSLPPLIEKARCRWKKGHGVY